jgi:hypothetical protein
MPKYVTAAGSSFVAAAGPRKDGPERLRSNGFSAARARSELEARAELDHARVVGTRQLPGLANDP